MNAVMMMILIITSLCLWRGYAHGLFRTAIIVAALLAAMFLSGWACPYVSRFLQQHTSIDEKLEETIIENLCLDVTQSADTKNEQMLLIESLPVPDSVKLAVINHNNDETYAGLNVAGFQEYLARYLTGILLNCLAYLLVQLLLAVGVAVLIYVTRELTEIPILHGIDKGGGLLLGLAESLAIIWILFIGISLLGSTQLGTALLMQISGHTALNYLYEHNYLLNIVTDIAGLM